MSDTRKPGVTPDLHAAGEARRMVIFDIFGRRSHYFSPNPEGSLNSREREREKKKRDVETHVYTQ